MNKYLLIVSFLFITGFSFAQKGYIIEGNITGLPDGTIQLKKVFDGKVLDETTSKDGKFIFKHEDKFVGDKVLLAGAGLKYRLMFYLEPGKIKLDGDASKSIV